MKKILLIIMMAIGCVTGGAAQNIAVSTDAVWDAMLVPSLSAELVMTKKSSLNINVLYGWNFLYKDMKIGAFQPEWRIYLSGRPMYHHYIGVMGLLATYRLNIKGKVNDGDAFGGGITYGYVLPIGRRWTVNFHTSLGYVWYRQKEYEVGDAAPDEVNSTGSLLFPMRLGIAFAYIIK